MSDSDLKGRGGADRGGRPSQAPEPESVVWLMDDAGGEHPHELLEVLDVGEHAYAALLVLETGPSGEARIPARTVMNFLRVEFDDDGEEILVEIDAPEEVEAVFAAWQSWLDALAF